MSTKLLLSVWVCLGLSACVTDEDDPLDDHPSATDPDAGPSPDDEDPSANVVLPSTLHPTCGGQPRRKGDGQCLPP